MTTSSQKQKVDTDAPIAARLGDETLHELLVDSSRTFALAIPLLEANLRRQVTIAYLLFRIADTLEDGGTLWSRERRLAALEDFRALLGREGAEEASSLAASWMEDPPTDHPGYLRLLRSTPGVLASWEEIPGPARACIAEQTRRTAARMSDFVRRGDSAGVLTLESLEDLRAYCYAVAGIVGEMLTELFILAVPGLAVSAEDLRRRAASFGEGLQLVNILKDSKADEQEGRCFIPPGVSRRQVFALARRNLAAAGEYVAAVQGVGACDGIVAFTALPVALARAALDAVEERGPGAKISREAVFELYDNVLRCIAAGRPALPDGAAETASE